jgi:hypothetical protein
MRLYLVLASTTLLAACGGTGSSGKIPLVLAPTGATTSTGAPSTHTFAKPTETKTYVGIGGTQVFDYYTDDRGANYQAGQRYAANTTTIRNSGISISYDPASAIFSLEVKDSGSGASTNSRFQDPAQRTNFGGAAEPQPGTPKFNNTNVNYLEEGTSSGALYRDATSGFPYKLPGTDDGNYNHTTLFYLKPGTETQYVTYAGYLRNSFIFSTVKPVVPAGQVPVPYEKITSTLERGAFAFGETSQNSAVPKTGTATYRGSMLATMIFNPTLDGLDPSTSNVLSSYFQWIEGTSKLDLDFLNNSFNFGLSGTVKAPDYDRNTFPQQTVLVDGATFAASGRGTINLVSFGGFKGQFQSANFVNPNGSARTVNIAGSTIDGAFYGPAGQEAGGGFRIVGGTPDERIDILGAFIGK